MNDILKEFKSVKKALEKGGDEDDDEPILSQPGKNKGKGKFLSKSPSKLTEGKGKKKNKSTGKDKKSKLANKK